MCYVDKILNIVLLYLKPYGSTEKSGIFYNFLQLTKLHSIFKHLFLMPLILSIKISNLILCYSHFWKDTYTHINLYSKNIIFELKKKDVRCDCHFFLWIQQFCAQNYQWLFNRDQHVCWFFWYGGWWHSPILQLSVVFLCKRTPLNVPKERNPRVNVWGIGSPQKLVFRLIICSAKLSLSHIRELK